MQASEVVDNDSESFDCPTCHTHYRCVTMKAPPTTIGREPVVCLKCGQPLESGGDDFVWKYFRIHRRHAPVKSAD
jgi:hypothetical protein